MEFIALKSFLYRKLKIVKRNMLHIQQIKIFYILINCSSLGKKPIEIKYLVMIIPISYPVM